MYQLDDVVVVALVVVVEDLALLYFLNVSDLPREKCVKIQHLLQ